MVYCLQRLSPELAEDVLLDTIFKGIFPFLMAGFARLITLIAFPSLTLWLTQLLR
jgi:TRAP-type C4-dicarboxylate transport system permease large subunit